MTDTPFIDYAQFSEETSEPWETLWNPDLEIWENFAEILQDSVLVPHASVQIPIAIAYLCTPSAIAKILPILFCHGRKAGVGKSNVGKLASYIWGVPINTASTTFAAVRNHLLECKYIQHDGEFYEQNTILVLDDIDKRFFQEKIDIYRLFKSGYDRSTDTIQIAGERGTNFKFRCFSGRVVSSVSPLYADPDFPELARRCFVLKFKKYEDFLPNEIERWGQKTFYQGNEFDAVLGGSAHRFNVLERLNLDTINWRGFDNHIKDYWSDTNNCVRYVQFRKRLNSRKKDFDLPEGLSGEFWTISIDILSTGLTMGIWPNIQSAVDFLGLYHNWTNNTKSNEYGATMKILRELIESEIGYAVKVNEQAGQQVLPLVIAPKKVKEALDNALKKGELDLSPSIDNIKNCMRELGWKLDVRSWVPDKG